jgi:hypothetical protein
MCLKRVWHNHCFKVGVSKVGGAFVVDRNGTRWSVCSAMDQLQENIEGIKPLIADGEKNWIHVWHFLARFVPGVGGFR